MNSLGWNDPVEKSLVLVYRRKGERREEKFSGTVYIIGAEDQLTHVTREEIGDRLDLTKVPVIGIGGKRKHQPARVKEFLASNKGFQGAFLLYPGSGNWDLGEGMVFLTSRDILGGKHVGGGRPEVQLTNHRWLRDGKYVADRAKMLHGKVLETVETAVEQEPGSEKIAEALTGWSCSFDHQLHEVCKTVASELHDLESRRVILSGEKTRDMTALVRENMTKKLQAANVRKVASIPGSLTVTPAEIDSDLVAQAETLGTIEVSGVGRRPITRQYAQLGFGDQVPTVTISVEEFRTLESWQFDKVYPILNEIGDTREQLNYGAREAMEAPEAERLGKFREYFARLWLDVQRGKNRPQDQKVTNPRETDPPSTPDPVVWGYDLLTGEAKTVYAALYHSVGGCKGRIVDSGWSIRWYDDADEAAKAETEARREAGSYITARRLEAELTANAKAVELPVSVPVPFVALTHTPQQILALAGFSEDQYRIREDVGHWYSAGWSGGRDRYDVEWSDGCPATGSFAQKGKDGVWEIGSSGLSHLFEGGSIGNYGRTAFAKPVLAEMGAGEKIATIQAEIKTEREAAEEAHRATIRTFAKALQAQPVYSSLSSDMQAKLASMAETNWGTPSVDEAELRKEWAKAEALHALQNSGEVLTNWGGHFRTMGATGNCDFWVVRPDGSLRDPDEISYRKRYTSEGEKQWRLVGPDEIAIMWSKAFTAADHEFTVAKAPTGSLTSAQLETVKRLESEIAERFQGAMGMSGKSSPGIGKGWELAPKPAPKPVAPPADAKPASNDEVKSSLAALQAKFGKKR